MVEPKSFRTPLSDKQPDDIGGCSNPAIDCGVLEGQFPLTGKCCSQSHSISGAVYTKNCCCCSIWNSLPDGASLAVTHIIECSRYGYGIRTKE